MFIQMYVNLFIRTSVVNINGHRRSFSLWKVSVCLSLFLQLALMTNGRHT